MCAFKGCSGTTKLIIPKGSLKYIGDNAFTGCVKIDRVEITDNVAYLGPQVFSKCNGLREVILPLNLNEISEGLFCMCTQMENIKLPQTIVTLGKDAFTKLLQIGEDFSSRRTVMHKTVCVFGKWSKESKHSFKCN